MSKPKTQEQLDRIASKNLEKKYGRDLAWYDSELEKQGGGCALCGSTEKTRRLHVDHDHSYVKVKIRTEKNPYFAAGQWYAEGFYRGIMFSDIASKKSEAIKMVKRKLKVASVRGLLCFRCNKFIVGFGGPEILRKAADYLEAHQGRLK